MPIYPLPPQESAATLFCNYSFFKGQGHHWSAERRSKANTRVDWLSCQKSKGTSTSAPRPYSSPEKQLSLPPLSTTSLLLFLTFYTHLFFCNPCFPNTHQHNSHTFPLYSISICNSQGILQKATNKLLPPPKVTQKIRA